MLEVPCPSCNAPIGVKCRRPSGHSCEPHAPRDIAADRAGHYGDCPLGLCGLENVARRRDPQLSLFAEAASQARPAPDAARPGGETDLSRASGKTHRERSSPLKKEQTHAT
ncbi:MAG: hypothetical protein RLN66_01655 [Roseitalea porphyridii]